MDEKKIPWLDAAHREVGVRERDGGASKYFELWGKGKYDAKSTAWCSAFVSWVLSASIGEKEKHLVAREWMQYGIDLHGRPIWGAIVILKRPHSQPWQGHVGFSVDSRRDAPDVRILGGNQGDKVSVAIYERQSILKCVWPTGQGDLLGGK